MTARRILLLDGCTATREALAAALRADASLHVTGTARGGDAQAQAATADAIIVGATLADMDGWSACRLLRRAGIRGPILLLTDTASPTNSAAADGPSETLSRPVRLRTVLARLRAHLPTLIGGVIIGPWRFTPADRTLRRRGADAPSGASDGTTPASLTLTGQEAALLTCLAAAPEWMADRETLLRQAWRTLVAPHTLETHIHRLRRKIEDDPAHPRLLTTIRGGYRLAVTPPR